MIITKTLRIGKLGNCIMSTTNLSYLLSRESRPSTVLAGKIRAITVN